MNSSQSFDPPDWFDDDIVELKKAENLN